MSTRVQPYILSFPEGFDERAEFELPYRGYLPDVTLELDDGTRHRLSFIDMARLEQGLTDDCRMGRHDFVEPGLVVLPEVTTEAIQRAVQGLWDRKFFLPNRLQSEGRSSG
jgi:hypothetical protein